ncbi:hypothetical protein BK132_08770 [Paenibacillus sp. FSL H8-0259]|nr:hypothetical protein BK132_08770 [Paenibacillus sp. FSL H8-0259]
MQLFMKNSRRLGMAAGVILASVAVLYLLLYMYERPGGWSDQRMSRSLGMDQTLQIPLGKSPEEAVRLFRASDTMTVIHQEPAARGELVFLTRPGQQGSSNLQVEYVRKTWLGWKWVWGGGYGMGGGPESSAINYMCFPELEHISTPFPMVIGDVLNPSIQHITVEQKEAGTDTSEAKLIKVGSDRTIWFAFQPVTAGVPFEIEGFDEDGEVAASKIITDARDSGAIPLGGSK